jgi:hypothetical protein
MMQTTTNDLSCDTPECYPTEHGRRAMVPGLDRRTVNAFSCQVATPTRAGRRLHAEEGKATVTRVFARSSG